MSAAAGHMLLRTIRGAVIAAMATSMLSGCASSPDPYTPEGSAQSQKAADTMRNELRTRPNYEQGKAEYLAMLTEMRVAISAVVPTLKWETESPSETGSSLCELPYSDLFDAQSGIFDSGSAIGAIPDSAWPQVRQAVIDIAARHRFTSAQGLIDKAGDHVLIIKDGQHGSLELMTQVNTTLTVYSPCMLKATPPESPGSSTSA